MVASSEPRWLRGAFDTLVGLFDRVGLRTNVGETVDMIYRPFRVAVNQSEEAYGGGCGGATLGGVDGRGVGGAEQACIGGYSPV